MLIDMGISSLPLKCSLHIIYSDEVNSFNALTEDSFVICLTSALLQRKGMTREIIMGIVANEFSHGALQHRLRGLYAGAKKRRKNELSASIISGLNAFASGFESGITGNAYDRTYNYLLNNDLQNKAKTSPELGNTVNAAVRRSRAKNSMRNELYKISNFLICYGY